MILAGVEVEKNIRNVISPTELLNVISFLYAQEEAESSIRAFKEKMA